MLTLVMAAGRNDRWNFYKKEGQPEFKQLVDIYGVRLIDRTINQLNRRSIRHMVVVSNPKLADKLEKTAYSIIDPQPTLVHSVLAMKHVWSYPLTILLGDVLFDPNDLDVIHHSPAAAVSFFGKAFETHAVRFEGDPTHLLLSTVCRLGYDVYSDRTNEGKLRDVRYFLRYGRLPPKVGFDERASRESDPNFTFLSGWSTDVDHGAAYAWVMHNPTIREALEQEKVTKLSKQEGS